MEKFIKIVSKHIWLLVILSTIPTIWALLVPGYFGASDDLHIAWLFEMHKTLMLGQIPPRYVPDLSFGFGYPLFDFVYPLPFYLGELFHLGGLNLVDSIKAVFLISMPLSAYFMFLLIKEFSDELLALTGAVVYTYATYRANDLYNRGSIGEIVSFIFLPLLLLAVNKLTRAQNFPRKYLLNWAGIAGLAVACLVLTHNITAYMFIPFAVLYGLLRLILIASQKSRQTLFLIAGGVFGLLISCYFWIPAIMDSSLMKYDTVFNFVDHFPTLKQLVTPHWSYGASVAGPYDGMSFFLGWGILTVFIVGIVSMVLNWKHIDIERKILLSWVLFSTIIAIILMNYRSTILWQKIPLLPLFQFPWRFLILTTLVMPLMVVAIQGVKFAKYIGLFIILVSIVSSWWYFRPHDFLGRTDDYYINRYIPVPTASSEYLKTGEEYLRLPQVTQKRPTANYAPAFSDTGSIANITQVNDLNTLVKVYSDYGMVLNYNKYLFPGWVATIDGQSTTIDAGKPFGQVAVVVPKGSHRVEVKFIETTFKKLLDAISLAAFLVSLWVVKNLCLRSKNIGHSS